VPVALLWGYAALVGIWLLAGWGGPTVTDTLANWNPAPAQLALLAYMAYNLRRMPAGLRRTAWWLVFAAVAIDLVGVLFWLYTLPAEHQQYVVWDDAVFLVYYPVLALACALFILDLGGTFRGWRVWIEMATLALGLGATLWILLLDPAISRSMPVRGKMFGLLMFATAIGGLMVMAARLYTQVSDWRRERALGLLIAALSLGFAADMLWLRAKVADSFPTDSWFDVVAYCAFNAMIATAVMLDRGRIAAGLRLTPVESNSFLPTLAVLLAVTMLFGESAALDGIRGWIATACTLGGALLLAARQLGVRHEIRGLQTALVTMRAEAILTEVTRRSSDLVMIVNRERRIAYVSPSSAAVLGIASSDLVMSPAIGFLGPGNQARLSAFYDDIVKSRPDSVELAAAFSTASGDRRELSVIGTDHLDSELIAGLVINARDVTVQRRLERELLDVVARERERLAGDMHEGLGQELTGVALLLKAHVNEFSPGDGPARSSAEEIIAHVNKSINLSRTIARGLSPLQVARGSIEGALENLSAEMSAQYAVKVQVHCDVDGAEIDPTAADHLYRIAVEAMNNALRHSGCSAVEIGLSCDPRVLTLFVADNGSGFRYGRVADMGLGLRMMGYRARSLGGSLRVEAQPAGGTRILVTVPREGLTPPPTSRMMVPPIFESQRLH
jgi:PAS domain S-box-containing protein